MTRPSTHVEDVLIPRSIFCRAKRTAWPLELVSKMLDDHFPGCKMTPKGTQINGTSQLLISFEVLFQTEDEVTTFLTNPLASLDLRRLSVDYTLSRTKHTTSQVLVKSNGTMSFSDEEFNRRRADIQQCINQHPYHIHNRYAIRHYPDESVRVLFANREDLEQFRAAFHANQDKLKDLHSLHPNDKLNNAQDLFIQIQDPPRRQHQTFSEGEIDKIKLRLRNLIESVRVAVLADCRWNNEIRTDTDFVRSLTHHQTGTQTHPSHVIFCKFNQPTVWANMLVCFSLFHRFRSILFPSLQIAKTTAEKLSHKLKVIKKNRQKTILLFPIRVGRRDVTCEISVNGPDRNDVKRLVAKDASDLRAVQSQSSSPASQTQPQPNRFSGTNSPPSTKYITFSPTMHDAYPMPGLNTTRFILSPPQSSQTSTRTIPSFQTVCSVSPPQAQFRSGSLIKQSFNPIHPYLLPSHHIPDHTQTASLPHSWQGPPSMNGPNNRSRIPGQTLLKANVSPFVPKLEPKPTLPPIATEPTSQDQLQRRSQPDITHRSRSDSAPSQYAQEGSYREVDPTQHLRIQSPVSSWNTDILSFEGSSPSNSFSSFSSEIESDFTQSPLSSILSPLNRDESFYNIRDLSPSPPDVPSPSHSNDPSSEDGNQFQDAGSLFDGSESDVVYPETELQPTPPLPFDVDPSATPNQGGGVDSI
ncbi:hypothetical protein BLNAU_20643 [Blattamonas nauphoetae]|uniref:Uncharacterized protein n=1 Tax=Blattamonas nauphoetae TaxID=2049346 RepID=A0ABQ9WZ92_9EUKA|nr:hypothetical protein BLNAU_20643 [Blattamonas nauphoetae]